MRKPPAAVRLSLALLALAAPAHAWASTGPPPVGHVFVVVLENENADVTFAPGSPAPYLSQTLPSQGAFIPEYYGVTHLSLGNYIALVSGQGSNPQTQADCQYLHRLHRHRACSVRRPGARPGLRLPALRVRPRRPARRRAA